MLVRTNQILPGRSIELEDTRALVFGIAFGDALGFRTQFFDRGTIEEFFGPLGVQDLGAPTAFFSDDTQMSLAVIRALASERLSNIDSFMGDLSREFIRWVQSPECNRAAGAACRMGALNLAAGHSWRDSGVADAKGCGAAMRSAPLGMIFRNQPQELIEFTEAASRCTHNEGSAIASAIVNAWAIKLAIEKAEPLQILEESRILFGERSIFLKERLDLASSLLKLDTPAQTAMDMIGPGWMGAEAIAVALYCCCKHPNSYVDAVRLAANHSGDSDSIAALVGGIQATRLGVRSLPADWFSRIENPQTLEEAASMLFRVARTR